MSNQEKDTPMVVEDNKEINELRDQVKLLNEQVENLKKDNSTLFKVMNENLTKIVKNTEKDNNPEPKLKRF